MLATIVITVLAGEPTPAGPRNAAIACLAFSFGIQNAAVSVIKVPDLTTSVITRTLADLGRAPGPVLLRRGLSWLCVLIGAVIGGLLVLHTSVPVTLAVVVAVQLVVIVVVATRRPAPWMKTHSPAAPSAKSPPATE
nr:YoaK family protein [uncultured Actinoplanes sp.]